MRRILVLTVTMVVMLGLAVPASAGGGAAQLSALGRPADGTECLDRSADFPIRIVGNSAGWSLDGCLYQTFGPGGFRPSHTYFETGTEVFVGELLYNGSVEGSGAFETTYVFTGKFTDAEFSEEIFGRCQHPITRGAGDGVFEGATGRLDFKDDVAAGNFPMRGHIRLEG